MRKLTAILLTASMVLMSFTTAFAGGPFESFDITAGTPSPIPGHILARAIQIRWDPRTIPVPYRMNNTLDPVPNPLGAPVLTVAQATVGMQAAFDAWNNIPTSYINMQIVGQTNNLGLIGL